MCFILKIIINLWILEAFISVIVYVARTFSLLSTQLELLNLTSYNSYYLYYYQHPLTFGDKSLSDRGGSSIDVGLRG